MPAGEERDQQFFDDGALADDHLAELAGDPLTSGVQPFDGLDVVLGRTVFRGVFHAGLNAIEAGKEEPRLARVPAAPWRGPTWPLPRHPNEVHD